MMGDSQAPAPLLPPEGAQEPPAEAAGVRAPTVSTSHRHGRGDRDGGRGLRPAMYLHPCHARHKRSVICKLCLDNLPVRIVVVIVVVVGQPPCGRMAAPIAASRRACIGIRSCDDLSSNNSPSLIIITTER